MGRWVCGGSGTIFVQAASRFVYSADIDIEEQSVQSGETITIDWSGLSTNLYGDPPDRPTDVGDGLVNDDPVQSDLGDAL